MTTKDILNQLVSDNIIAPEQSSAISEYESGKAFSVHWELRSILYLGIVIFGSGLGVIIYQNIDTIGHQVIIALIALLMTACFAYTIKKRVPFSWALVESPEKFSPHSLLLGCTLLLILEGYLQYQYTIFGTRYGLAVLIPTIVFFFCAYRFDHRGILSMAITGLASWLGLTIAPLSVLSDNDFTDIKLLATAISLGLVLMAISRLSQDKGLKSHFAFTYLLLGGNLAALASLTAMFSTEPKILFMISAAAVSFYYIRYSRQAQSLLFLLLGVIYGYIVVTYGLFIITPDEALAALAIYYFLFSSIGVIFFLLNVKKILGTTNEKSI
ncbi:hypothetical protein DYBT9275_02100 [Dyadobacter sp. CECT 9275]|uniref:DUF2157 domain-containing protein n=1 Tax=Dyadobacter helix TaxID=2822344 RepID=A0A916JAP3_9BACT|nr:DUF2157 domain-containing protein [Dyadobacter sp. CECT 9275]CAG4998881.1 hypothetical protein DYBT9275_02100 [Dyadobacter sp. CECT 9275]